MLLMKILTLLLLVIFLPGCNPPASAGKGNKDRTRPPPPARQIVVKEFVISADGKLLLSQLAVEAAGGDWPAPANFKHLRLWNLQTAEEIRSFTEKLIPLAFLPDNKHVLLASATDVVTVWEVRKGQKTGRLGGSAALGGDLLLSADGKIAIGFHRLQDWKSCEVMVWDVPSGELLRTLDGPLALYSLVLSPDGKRATTSQQNTENPAKFVLKVWDLTTGKLLRSFDWSNGWLGPISVDGKFAMLFLEEQPKKYSMLLWDLIEGKSVKKFGNLGTPFSFSEDGKQVFATYGRDTLRLWDLATGKEIWSVKAETLIRLRLFRNAQLVMSKKAKDPKFWAELNEKVLRILDSEN
jgi:WD40 repeat protein